MLKILGSALLLPLILFYFFPLSSHASAQEKEIRIKQIEIKGNHKIDTATILSKLSLKEGDLFSPERIQEDVKILYKMGYFDQVEAESEGFEGGIALSFIVHEKPILIDVIYEGNQHLDKDKLKEKVPVKAQTFLDSEEIKGYVEKIKKLYEGEAYYDAQVIPVTRLLSEDKAILTFLIKEGEQAYIRKIYFTGNRAFKEKALKKALESSEYFWLTSWLTESGRYKEETIEGDLERIREFYLSHGYLQMQAGAPKVDLSGDKKWFDITFPISEGDQFKIGKLTYEGNKLFDTFRLKEVTQSKEGAIFNRSQVRQDIAAMVDLYGEKGYIYANVVPQLAPHPEEKTVDIDFQLTEEDPVKVREINITGNDKTRDKVIRREIRVNEQELVNTRLLRRSFQRLQNLNFFENVEIVPEQVEKGWVDLDVKIKEKPTGSFSVGGGYSSVDRFIATIEVSQGNLFGNGELVRAKVEAGKLRKTYSLTFGEPYFLDSNISATVDLFNQLRDFSTYQEKRVGGDLIFGRSFGEYVSASVSYTLETLDIIDVGAGVPSLIQSQAALGKTLTSAVGFSLARDTRDFTFDPKSGAYNRISVQHAGTFLGGDNDYHKIIGDSGIFFPLWLDHVLSLHARAGYIAGLEGKAVPVGERFFVGGINTVRGFQFGKAGPMATTGEILGGNKQLFFNTEYLIPLVPEARIKGLLFFDEGRAFDNSERIDISELRRSAGFGIRWISPVGPLRLEWGKNLRRKPGEKSYTIEFSIGTLF